ncbi:hypothetical protein NIES2111_26410 [Nostoc sp. NIES-2111]|nr:hypothetical protein NIES2111_26410 [Nostoc sp. NIES-2111]
MSLVISHWSLVHSQQSTVNSFSPFPLLGGARGGFLPHLPHLPPYEKQATSPPLLNFTLDEFLPTKLLPVRLWLWVGCLEALVVASRLERQRRSLL